MNLYPDIGELGWSLYLYGYLNKKWEDGDRDFSVVTLKDRRSIFDNIGCQVFYTNLTDRLRNAAQDGFGLFGIPDSELREYFNTCGHAGEQIAPEFRFGCHRFFDGKMKFKPLKVEISIPVNRILIFPRKRTSQHHSFRNLNKSFYVELIKQLCAKYTNHLVESIGVPGGAYEIGEKNMPLNFRDLVGNITTIQTLIDICSTASVAIGGTSAPPKISMLQGVPTFLLGHEKRRFMVDDNWMRTKAGFYEFGKDEYQSFNESEAIEAVLKFVKDVI